MNEEFHVHGAKVTREKPKAEPEKPVEPPKADQTSTESGGGVPTTPEENKIIDDNIARRRNALKELARK